MKRFWATDQFLQLAYLIAALAISLQWLSLGANQYGYTIYENYIIFKNSFTHLVQGQNPYGIYIIEQWDLYKYSPAFTLVMAPFTVLPDWLGLQLWNLLNAMPLVWAVLRIPGLTPQQRRFLGWFILPELIISIQNSQSNGLTVALLLWSWIAVERSKPVWSAWWAAAGGFLKIFGGFAAVPALVYPQRMRFLSALAVWAVILLLIPLVVISPSHLWQVYQWWFELLREDHSASVGLSIEGWLLSWFGWTAPKLGITALGMLVFGASAWAVWRQRDASGMPPAAARRLLWASLLIWVVIFNHKAESPTFVIALTGVALWYLNFDKPVWWAKTLLWTAFALASLSPTDIFPRELRQQIVQPYVLKAVPCILVWFLISIRLLRPLTQRLPLPPHE